LTCTSCATASSAPTAGTGIPTRPPEEFREPACLARKPNFKPVEIHATPRTPTPGNLPETPKDGEVPGRILRAVRQPYPEALVEADIQGTVVLAVEVTAEGQVRCARVAQSSGYAQLDALAVTAVSQFKFDAASVDGVPVDSIFKYTYRFELTDGRAPPIVPPS
jgi:protein TonB